MFSFIFFSFSNRLHFFLFLSSPLLSSPHLTSPHLTSPHLTSPLLTSLHLSSPLLTSPLLFNFSSPPHFLFAGTCQSQTLATSISTKSSPNSFPRRARLKTASASPTRHGVSASKTEHVPSVAFQTSFPIMVASPASHRSSHAATASGSGGRTVYVIQVQERKQDQLKLLKIRLETRVPTVRLGHRLTNAMSLASSHGHRSPLVIPRRESKRERQPLLLSQRTVVLLAHRQRKGHVPLTALSPCLSGQCVMLRRGSRRERPRSHKLR